MQSNFCRLYTALQLNTSKLKIVLLFVGYFVFSSPIVKAQDAVKRYKNYNLEKGVALHGYDVMSYYAGKPQKGKAEISYNFKGVIYLFALTSNLETFKKDPEKYEPTYGGWCAYAVGKTGEKVDPDPTNFKIKDGKIFLFYKSFFSNTLDDWNKDEVELKRKADSNWPSLLK